MMVLALPPGATFPLVLFTAVTVLVGADGGITALLTGVDGKSFTHDGTCVGPTVVDLIGVFTVGLIVTGLATGGAGAGLGAGLGAGFALTGAPAAAGLGATGAGLGAGFALTGAPAAAGLGTYPPAALRIGFFEPNFLVAMITPIVEALVAVDYQ